MRSSSFGDENFDLDFLQKYSPKRLGLKKINSGLGKLLHQEKCLALVTGENEEFKDWEIDLPVLKPLVAYAQEEIREKLIGFKDE